MYKKIPECIQVGGQHVDIIHEDYVDGSCGLCSLAEGWIKIANKISIDCFQSESCKVNTFYHELTHAILYTMGRPDLSEDENFVSCFSSFLTEAMKDAEFRFE